MRIVMFSINPLFPGMVMGGAPKHLQSVAIHLGQLGHDVTVLCTRVAESSLPFHWHENVRVVPILRFKQPFPQPYGVTAHDLANILQDMGDYLVTADRFYMHDGEFLLPYAYQHIPTVVSLRDNVYPETILGGFLAQTHKLILISEYSYKYYQQTVGRFFPEFHERATIIHNGLDWAKFTYTKPNEILDYLPVRPKEGQPVLLHPHRPESTKGIFQSIAVVDLLVHHHGISDLIAFAPKWLDLQLTPELSEFYAGVEAEIHQRGLENNFLFHGWIPQPLMPQYYSLGSVTLSLGSFPESFGNAVYESLGCGTPSVVARIATHRELVPDHLIDKVDYDDAQAAAEKSAQIIKNKRRTSPETMAYIHEHYSTERQLKAYADAIVNAQIVPPMRYVHPKLDEETRYKLPVWCYLTEKGVYNDFWATYHPLGLLENVIKTYPSGFTRAQAEALDVSDEAIEIAYRDGFLVPIP